MADTTTRDIRIKRMTYRSWHRGCKETDIILGHYADHQLAKLDDAQLDLFEQFLDEQDADIWKWLTGELQPPRTEYVALLATLQEYSDFAKVQ